MLNEVEAVISSLNENVDNVGADLAQVKSVLSGITFLEQTKLYSERIEVERYYCICCCCVLVRSDAFFSRVNASLSSVHQTKHVSKGTHLSAGGYKPLKSVRDIRKAFRECSLH